MGSYHMRQIWSKVWMKTVLVIFAAAIVFPFLVMVLTALKSDQEISRGLSAIFPETPVFSNFAAAMQKGNWSRYFFNTTVITIFAVVLSLLINSLAGYAFARMRFIGKTVLFYCAMVGMMLPMQVIMIPVFLQIKEFPLVGGNDLWGNGGIGLVNSYAGVIFPLIAHPFGIFLCRQFFLGFPKELDEAAKIDGCSSLQIYLKLYVPMGTPIFATLGLLKFVDTWNQYTWPLLVFNDPEMNTVQLALNAFKGENVTEWNYLMAATIVIILPILVLFLFLQKYFVQGIATTGMKD